LSITITLKQSGYDLSRLPEDVREKLVPTMIQFCADYAHKEMTRAAPRGRTGDLKASIVKEVSALEAFIGSRLSYAPHVEYGTRPHEIRPVRARALRFTIESQVVFAMRVQHPGTRAQPFVRETGMKLVNRVSELWSKAFREIVG